MHSGLLDFFTQVRVLFSTLALSSQIFWTLTFIDEPFYGVPLPWKSARWTWATIYTNYSVSSGLRIECTVPMLITPAVSCSVPGSHRVSLLRFSLLARKLWVELRSVLWGLECGTEWSELSLGIIRHLRGSEFVSGERAVSDLTGRLCTTQSISASHLSVSLWGDLIQHPPQVWHSCTLQIWGIKKLLSGSKVTS